MQTQSKTHGAARAKASRVIIGDQATAGMCGAHQRFGGEVGTHAIRHARAYGMSRVQCVMLARRRRNVKVGLRLAGDVVGAELAGEASKPKQQAGLPPRRRACQRRCWGRQAV